MSHVFEHHPKNNEFKSVLSERGFYTGSAQDVANGKALGGGKLRSKILEIDCEDGATNSDLVLIPAAANGNGLLVTRIIALVSEQFGGGTEDQGIITVSDESDNALTTLTPTDGGADAVNDYVLGYSDDDVATGAAAKVVAAGEFVDCAVTQATSGASAAGKMKVIVEYYEL